MSPPRPRLAAALPRPARRDLGGARRLTPDMPPLAAHRLQQAAEKIAEVAPDPDPDELRRRAGEIEALLAEAEAG